MGYGGDEGALRSLVEKTDVLLAFGPLLLDHPWIGETGVPVIADLYDPAPLEALVMHADLAMDVQRARHRAVLAAHRALLERGDVFLCASERQRHLVVGMLAALGRVEPLTFAGDPGLDDLVRVVPFGVPSEPPTPVSPSPLRDAHPAMQPDDFLLLWAGGIYEWLDPVVLVEALSAIDDPTVKAFFMGGRHPDTDRPAHADRRPSGCSGRGAGARGQPSGVRRRVDPLPPAGGVPVRRRRGRVLPPAPRRGHLRLRTRVLDYLWAGLPILCSDGDAMADLVRTHDLGEVVPPGDVDAVAGAISRLRDEAHREGCGERSARVAADFRWDRVCQPIARFCRDPRRAPDLVAGPPAREGSLAGSAAGRCCVEAGGR